METPQEPENRRSDRSTKGKSTPKYGTKEYLEFEKRVQEQQKLLDSGQLDSSGQRVATPGPSHSTGMAGFLPPHQSESQTGRAQGSKASVQGSQRSSSTFCDLKKKEADLKMQQKVCEMEEKISKIESGILDKQIDLFDLGEEIKKLEEEAKTIPEDKEEDKKRIESKVVWKTKQYEAVNAKLQLEQAKAKTQVKDLKNKIKLVKSEGDVLKAQIEFEEEQAQMSDPEDNVDEKVLQWNDKNKQVVLFDDQGTLQTEESLEQQRKAEQRKAVEDHKILLKFQQQRVNEQAAFTANMVRLQEEETRVADRLRHRQHQPIPNVPNPNVVVPPRNPNVFMPPASAFYPVNTQFLARQSHGKDLPFFYGNPEEWLTFKGAYERTNLVCGFSPDENLNRIQKCLKGEALRYVQSLMTTPNNVPTILRKLETRFGQTESIIEAMTLKMRNIPPLKQDNPEGIIEFGGAVDNLVTTLQALKRPDHLLNPILLKEMETKMPLNWRIEWREWLKRECRMKDLSSFSLWLESKTTIVCELCPMKSQESKEKRNDREGNKDFKNKRHGERVMLAVDTAKKNEKPQDKERTCRFCSIIGHRLWECPKFKESDVQDRLKFVKVKRLCFRCLNFGHSLSECHSKRSCGKDGCTRKHHQLIHEEWKKPEVEREKKAENEISLHANPRTVENGRVLYKILPVTLLGPKGEEIDDFVFMDGGSGLTILDDGLADQLKLEKVKKPFSFEGLGYTGHRPQSWVVEFKIRSKYTGKVYQLTNVQTDQVNYLPQKSLSKDDIKKFKHLQGIPLSFYENAKPRLLLGIQHADLMETIQRTDAIGGRGPIAAETKLGWVLTGTLPPTVECPRNESILFLRDRDEELHQLVKKHFTTEDFGVKVTHAKIRSLEDQRAESIMEQTAQRVNGKWEMGLLWRDDEVQLPGSRGMAERRLKSVEKRMDTDPEYCKVYVDKVQEYLDKGFIRKLNPEEIPEDNKTWYLPHFGVTNPNKPGKFRLVFDAAAKSHGVSLNDKLLTGPDYVPSILAVLFRFRQRAVAFTGDISDMFHQVQMKKEDQSAQRFLWRGADRDRKPDVMVMQVMVFGAASSPSCAQYIKNRNAEEVGTKYPKAVKDIIKNHYVDDFLGSTDTVEEAVQRQQQVYEIHKQGGFRIVKWMSNSKEFIDMIPGDLQAEGAKNMNMDDLSFSERVLGLYWEPPEDKFTFKTIFHKIPKEVLDGSAMPTKREALALVMSVFDPIGFLALFTVKAKMLLQEAWRSKVDWDEELPEGIQDRWITWIKELKNIPNFRVPRCYSVGFSTAKVRELHVFVDASESAFAAVAYVRMELEDKVEVSFVAAKSKVAPLKPLSIPRMELQAALMGARLAETIKREHDYEFHESFYWSDSRTVLCWIRSDGRRFQQFVAHRVGEIQETTEVAEWKWVSTRDNVADEATRNKPSDWGPNSRWVNGPEFLKQPKSQWTSNDENENSGEELELKKEFVLMTTEKQKMECLVDLARFSSWLRLIRATAYFLRAVNAWMKKDRSRGTSCLSVMELQAAEEMWCKWSQAQTYKEEIFIIKSGGQLKASNPLAKLTPWIDESGLLRMRGRIPNDAEVYELDTNPIILHPKHPHTQLLIAHYHKSAGHHGMERVANELRQQYCIPNLRVAVKRAWNKCQACKNKRAKPLPPLMGNLPLARLNSFVHPFTVTGLDYFGPMDVTIGRRREKRYGALFTCMSTRAVHLEIAASLSTDSCLMAIRRFISRRGNPKDIFSDNGTNFVGANNELKKAILSINQKLMTDEMTTRGITWHFNPPAAPHMGGSWERLVKAVKVALEATLRERAPREEVLQTLMCEAENTVNGRPLTHVSCDPNDPEALTPNHFLVGRSNNIPSWRVRDDEEKCVRKLWEQGQQLADLFWKRWVREYLPTLTRRDKWFQEVKPIQTGDVVILVDNNQPRNNWPKGRVIATYPGKDGQVRTVEVKTANGTYKRPAVKVCVLDVNPQTPTKKEDEDFDAVLFLRKICAKKE